MQFLEYYSSALRHLDVCKLLLEKLSTMGVKKEKQMITIVISKISRQKIVSDNGLVVRLIL